MEKNDLPLTPEIKNKKIPIAALGGSAGALTPFEAFFINTFQESGIAYIVIQHLDPDKESLLPELISRNTKIPVHVITHGVEIRPDNIYVMPPNHEATMESGCMMLKQFDDFTNPNTHIDNFFTSLARHHGSLAAGIIFSGMGKDGTEGVKAIKAHKGITLAQRPNTASFDSMPCSAIETGMIDHVSAAEELPVILNNWAHREENKTTDDKLTIPLNVDPDSGLMQKIFELVLANTGNDFSLYKINTIRRRIESRMIFLKIYDLAAYVEYLETNSGEVITLFKELLIGVTDFFRDEESFEILKTKVLPPLLRSKKGNDTIRIWVSACSTGEEAYSMAIIIREIMDEMGESRSYRIQIFATDIDEDAIHFARIGIYSANASRLISGERLKRFFTKKGTAYQVNKEIREMVIFAQHSVIKDPPFTKLDILCCRNLLIYLTAELQRKVIYTFRYALHPNGILFLGSSETLGGYGDLFIPVDARWRIFRRRESASLSYRGEYQINMTIPKQINSQESKFLPDKSQEIFLAVQKELLHNFAPPSVVINKNYDIIYVNGETGKYLELSPGQASLNILELAREGLRFDLSSAIQEVSSMKNIVVRNDLMIKTGSSYQSVTIKVRPFAEVKENGLILIIFEDNIEPLISNPLLPGDKEIGSKTISDFQKELIYTKKHLQSTIEEMEISMEELTSANEESQSTNEELQSANEELTTSKEEMQSLNEELTGMNTELQHKIQDFSQLNNDMKNLLQNTDTAILFLDNQLNIKRFSPGAAKIIKLIPTDMGRPISDIVTNLRETDLITDIHEVLETLSSKEIEVKANSGEWYLIKISPYRTVDNFIEGAVVLFSNISDTKALNEKLLLSQMYNEKILESIRDSLILMDDRFSILSVNQAFYNNFKETSGNTLGKNFLEMRDGQWNKREINDALKKILENKIEFNDLRIAQHFEYLGYKELLMNGRIITGKNNEPNLLLLVIKDITNKEKHQE